MAIIARGQISVVTVDDGQSPVVYSLLPSCTAVHEDKAGVKTPDKISCRAVLAVGDQREVVGVDTKIAYKGRNLLSKQDWRINTGGFFLNELIPDPIPALPNTSYNLHRTGTADTSTDNWNLQLKQYKSDGASLGGSYLINTYRQNNVVFTSHPLAASFSFIFYYVYQQRPAAEVLSEFHASRIGLFQSSQIEKHTPAPEDYTIKRNGQAYTAGVDVTPTNDTAWTLHEPLAGAVIDSETVPLILDGTDGANAPRLKVQFSINGSTLWHDTYAAEDRYRRESNDGGLTWGVAMRMWGETGAAGADGKKTPYTEFSYAYGIAQPTVWNDAPPAKVEGQHLWERIRKYTPKADNSGWDLASTSYAIINEYIEIGGVNILKGTGQFVVGDIAPTYAGWGVSHIEQFKGNVVKKISTAWTGFRFPNFAENKLPYGCMLSFYARVDSGETRFSSFTQQGFSIVINSLDWKQYSIYLPAGTVVNNTGRNGIMETLSSNPVYISSIKLERGNRATDWSPAPEDIQSEIDSTKNSIADIFSDGKVTPDEKQQLKLRFDPIKLIHSQTVAKCTALGIDSAILVTSYTHLDSFITPILASMNTTSVASFEDINMRFKAWEVEYSAIQVRIAEKGSQNAITEADRLAKAEAEAKRNEMAQSIGYDSWADLDAAAKAGETMIEGGKINATLIETAALVTKLLAADSGFIKQLIVESLKTPSGRVEINDAIGKFGSIRLANEDSISIVDEAENEIIKMLRGEIPSLEDLTSKNQNTTVNFVQNPPSSFNYGWQPISVSGWTTVSSGGLLTVNNDNTTVSIINTTGGVAPQMTVNCLAPASGDSISVELVAELRNATGGVWIIDTMTHSASYGYTGVKKIPLTRTFYSMPKGTYSIAVKARIVSISGDAIAEYNYSTGRMSAVLVSAKNQSWFGRGLAVIRSATEWLHYGWRTVNGTKKWMLSYKGSIDFPGVLCAGRVNANGTLISSWGAKTVKAERHNGLQGRVKITHDLGHLNYFVTATMFSTGHQGPIVVMEKTTTYIVIGTGGLDGGWWNVDFDFIICGQN